MGCAAALAAAATAASECLLNARSISIFVARGLPHLRSLEARAATVLEVAQPGPAQLSQRWHADARSRVAAAVEQALNNWQTLAASGNSGSSSSSSEAGSRGAADGSSPAGSPAAPQQ